MPWLCDPAFLRALVTAPSFAQVVAPAAAALALLVGLTVFCLRRRLRERRRRPAGLLRDERGFAVAADFVITLPLLMATVSLIVQFATLLQGATFVHYAAYVAARSVRVHAWAESFPFVPLRISDEARARAERAARYVLIGASPADPGLPLQREPWAAGRDAARSYLRVLARGGASSAALARQAGYAFYPENARVAVRLVYPPFAAWVTAEASVDFWLHCGVLYGRLLGEQRRDGLWAVPVHADMRVF